MAIDDEPSPLVDRDLLDPANRIKGPREGRLLVARMETPVARIGEELVRRLLPGTRDAVAPRRRRGGGDARLGHQTTLDLRPCIVAPPE